MPDVAPNITDSAQLVVEIFHSYRERLLSQYGSAAFTRKPDHSQVTLLDVAIENDVRDALGWRFPEFGFLGEETGDHRFDSQAYWVVDPIDGTSSFIRGLPNCTNMAALIVDGETVAAVIYDFITDNLYEAYKGHGAFCNSVSLSVQERSIHDSAIYINGHQPVLTRWHEKIRAAELDIYRPFGASGKAYTLLAEGKIDGYMLLGSKVSIHDNAPGVLIALEAGASIATADHSQWSVETSDFIVGNKEVVSLFSNLFVER